MGIFTINRSAQTALGSGLPFMTSTRYQERFAEIGSPEAGGYWQVPQNKLPTWQVWYGFDLTKVELIPVSGVTDGTPIEIALAQIEKRCLDSGMKIYFTQDIARPFTLDCGQYYFKLSFGLQPALYSEVFVVGGVCCNGFDLSYTYTVLMDDSVDITFTLNHSNNANITQYSSDFNGTLYNTQTFTVNLPEGVTEDMVTEIDTQYCGVFYQTWRCRNSATILTVAKLYIP